MQYVILQSVKVLPSKNKMCKIFRFAVYNSDRHYFFILFSIEYYLWIHIDIYVYIISKINTRKIFNIL